MTFKTVPIGAAFDVKNGATPKSDQTSYWDGDIIWVGPADLGKLFTRYVKKGARNIMRTGYDSCGTQMVPSGAIILSIRAPIGHIAIASGDMCFNQGCRGLVPRSIISSQYGYWTLLSAKPQLEATGQGTTFIELSRNKLRSERIPLPGLDTQKIIAEFLDRETTQIDQLIEKKARFIEVLKEKRAALITQAVTRGIDADVQMKNLGIINTDRIRTQINLRPDLPNESNYPLVPIRYFLVANDGGTWGEDSISDNDPIVLRSTEQLVDGTWNIIDPARRNLSMREFKKTRLYVGDILVTKSSGSSNHIGKSSLVTLSVESLEVSYSNFMQRLRMSNKIFPEFATYLLNNKFVRYQMAFLSNTTTGLANLSTSIIGQM